jgi:hypothetical protein
LQVIWEIWKERNTRVFQNQSITSTLIVAKIKDEATTWVPRGVQKRRVM